MSFFSSKKALPVCTLIADLSPNSVGLGISEKGTDGKTKLVYTARQNISYTKKPSSHQMTTKIAEVLKAMTVEIRRKYSVTSACVVHSSAWSFAATTKIDIEFPQPIKLSEKLIMEAIAQHRSPQPKQSSLTLVYHHVQKVRLNGYTTEYPWDKTAHHLSCDLLEASVDNHMKQLADDILLPFAHKISHIPESIASLHAVQHLVPDMERTLLVHVGGEATEVVYGTNETIIASASAPMGIQDILRKIAHSLHGDMELAHSHMMMHVKGSRHATRKEQELINSAFETWRKEFFSAVHSVCGNSAVPQDIVVFTTPDYMSVILQIIDSAKIKAWTGRDHHVVNLFERKDVSMLVPVQSGVMQDFMIAAGAFYIVQ